MFKISYKRVQGFNGNKRNAVRFFILLNTVPNPSEFQTPVVSESVVDGEIRPSAKFLHSVTKKFSNTVLFLSISCTFFLFFFTEKIAFIRFANLTRTNVIFFFSFRKLSKKHENWRRRRGFASRKRGRIEQIIIYVITRRRISHRPR